MFVIILLNRVKSFPGLQISLATSTSIFPLGKTLDVPSFVTSLNEKDFVDNGSIKKRTLFRYKLPISLVSTSSDNKILVK